MLDERLDDWYDTDLGRMLLNSECDQIERALQSQYGYYSLQVASKKKRNRYVNIPNKIIIWPKESAIHSTDTFLFADPTALPFASDSIDLIILPHTLNMNKQREAILQEMHRVLTPHGALCIIGFNPASFWGLQKIFSFGKKAPIFSVPKLYAMKVRALLQQSGFQDVKTNTFFYRPFFSNTTIMRRLKFLDIILGYCLPDIGNMYLIVAKKQVLPMTPIKEKWYRQRATNWNIQRSNNGMRNQ